MNHPTPSAPAPDGAMSCTEKAKPEKSVQPSAVYYNGPKEQRVPLWIVIWAVAALLAAGFFLLK
jgi:hypothetical protein